MGDDDDRRAEGVPYVEDEAVQVAGGDRVEARGRLVKEDDGPADKQILIRTTDYERDRWKDASSKEQLTVSAWIRKTLNTEAKNILECLHPVEFVKYYPWARTCMKCGQRLP